MRIQLLDLFRGIFGKLGVDYPQLRLILQTKLMLDDRSGYAGVDNGSGQKKRQYLLLIFTYLIMGLIYAAILVGISDVMMAMGIIFSVLITILFLNVIGNFSSVILDLKDMDIIGPAPISPKTKNMAKVFHVVFFLLPITLISLVPAFITGWMKYGAIFVVLLLLTALLIDVLVVCLAVLTYGLILRFFDGEKLRDVINYVQIGLSLISMIGYQFVGQLFSVEQLKLAYQVSEVHFLLPPFWYAAPFGLILSPSKSIALVFLVVIGVMIPMLGLFVLAKNASKFEEGLRKLSNSTTKRRAKVKSDLFSPIAPRNSVERTFYSFGHQMMKRGRQLKMQLIPKLAMGALIPLLFSIRPLLEGWDPQIIQVMGPYSWFGILFILEGVDCLRFSEDAEGNWQILLTAGDDATNANRGLLKAYLMRFGLPAFLVVSLPMLLFQRLDHLPLMTYQALTLITLAPILYRLFVQLPFSVDLSAGGDGSGAGCLSILTSIFIVALPAGLYHLLDYFQPNYLWILTGAMAIAMIISWRFAFDPKAFRKYLELETMEEN